MSIAELKKEAILFLDKKRDSIKSSLPNHIDVDRFVLAAKSYIASKDMLFVYRREPSRPDMASFLNAIMFLARKGLFLDGRDAHLVRYGSAINPSPTWQGLLRLMRNSGEILDCGVNCVFENEIKEGKFRYIEGQMPEHEPMLLGDPGKLVAAYAWARTRHHGVYARLVRESDINKAKAASKTSGREDSPWNTHPEEMWRAKVLRRLMDFLPLSADVDYPIDMEFDHEVEVEPDTKPSSADDPAEEETEEKKPKRAATKKRGGSKTLDAVKKKAAEKKPEPEPEDADDIDDIDDERQSDEEVII